jgi:hypothetical protein
MALDVDKIRPVAEKIVGDLRTKIGTKGSDKWQLRETQIVKTQSGNEVEKLVKKEVKASDFLKILEDFQQHMIDNEHTQAFDSTLYKVFKPAFPHKDWLHASMDALDALNLTAVKANNGGAIPDGVFTEGELTEYAKQARYACGDSGRFSGVINHVENNDYYYYWQVLNRAYRAEADSKRATKAKAAQDSSPGDLSKNMSPSNFVSSAKSVCAATDEARSGICTTFAWAGAHPLMDRMMKRQSKTDRAEDGLKRVEVVAFTNHIFCVVNREGDALKINDPLPQPDEWNEDVIQLDIWMGTLGWPYIYQGVSGDNAGFLTPLKSLFDSKKVGWT